MELPLNGREYVTAFVSGLPEGTDLEASLDEQTWVPVTVDDSSASVLVAGPLTTDNPEGTLVMSPGANKVVVRAVPQPQILLRPFGIINCLDVKDMFH